MGDWAKAVDHMEPIDQEEWVCPSCEAYADVFLRGSDQGILVMYEKTDYVRALSTVFIWVDKVLIPTWAKQETLKVSDLKAPPVGFSYFEMTGEGWSQIAAWRS